MSSGALSQMPPVKIFDTTAEAVSDCHYVMATTARSRDMAKPVYNADGAATEIIQRTNNGQKTAFLFGAERTGLTNDDVALAHSIITFPLNPSFSSLNLGQSVLLLCYAWYQKITNSTEVTTHAEHNMPAPHEELNELCNRLEIELEKHHFFRSPEMRPSIVRNLKNMLSRADMSSQEVSTVHGIISALTGKKQPLDDK
jgi:tRNA/rRNA methyltransferase